MTDSGLTVLRSLSAAEDLARDSWATGNRKMTASKVADKNRSLQLRCISRNMILSSLTVFKFHYLGRQFLALTCISDNGRQSLSFRARSFGWPWCRTWQ